VESSGVEGVPVGLSLTRPDGAGQVFLTVRSELGALPTAVLESPTPSVVMAATGKRIHVVERPHDGLVRGSEERERVDEAIDPVQVVYVSVGN